MAPIDDSRLGGTRHLGPSHHRSYSDAPEVVITDEMHAPASPLPDDAGLGAEQEVPPAYSEHHDQLNLAQTGFNAGAHLTDDGRVDINISQTNRQLADLIAPALRNQLEEDSKYAQQAPLPPAYIPPSLGGLPGQKPPPRLNVVIQIVGSRGDVQPFIALGQVLKETYGHRVRVATHATFQKFVEENGLEFFSIGGDPAELMAFMVKNPGLMPGMDALKNGEITKRRKGISDILLGCWRSCIETGNGLGPAPHFPRPGRGGGGHDPSSSRGSPVPQPQAAVPSPPADAPFSEKPFIADAIIANPPSFAHIHLAEKLGVPLHLMFTMPWSPTRAFPQPLANIQSSNTDPVTTNYVSYTLVEMMTWQGLGDVINRFRSKILDLEPLSLMWAPAVLTRLRIPYTYCWSPALIPKPNDWGQHIDVAGFYFLNLASSYTPDPELAEFLAAGPPPVYIGFGSIVVDDPNGLTRMIFDAVAETGVRALVSKGWGGLGADDVGLPDGVFMLGNCPHDWLFQHVAAVCHHGGAGTTAAGIKAGKPTIVVPFFGDQPFWGAMVARAGAGPDPIPYKRLTTESLAEAIRVALRPETQTRAQELGYKIREEKGTDIGAQSFHTHLDVDNLRCSLVPSRAAVWRVRRTQTQLSPLAATALVQLGHLQWSDLKLFRSKEYSTEDHPTDPVTAVTSALVGDMTTIGMSIADFPRQVFKSPKHQRSKSQEPSEQATEENPRSDVNNASSASVITGDSELSMVRSSSETQGLASPVFSQQPTNSSTQSLTVSGGGGSESAGKQQQQLVRTRQQRSPSNPGSDPAAREPSPRPSPFSPENLEHTIEHAKGAGRSVETIVATGMRSPMNFCMGLARGFRNAPKLYNDDTVRPTEKVTSLGSGLRIAGKEFGLGVFDGVTGLVTQPVRGAVKEGGVGAVKGFGKGVGGFFFKNAAALWSIPAYAMAGVNAEIRTMFAQSAHNYIVASRISQGNEDYSQSNSAEIQDIESRWLAHAPHLKGFFAWRHKEKGKGKETASPDPTSESGSRTPPAAAAVSDESTEPPKTGWWRTKNLSFEERKRLHDLKEAWKKRKAGLIDTRIPETPPSTASSVQQQQQDEEMELAIQASVRETSRGDASEDARIEQAIRSSIAAMRHRSSSTVSGQTVSSSGASEQYYLPPPSRLPQQQPPQQGRYPNEKVLGGGYQTMMPTTPPPPPSFSAPNYAAGSSALPPNLQDLDQISDEEFQALIEKAVQLSISEQQKQWQWQQRQYGGQQSGGGQFDGSGSGDGAGILSEKEQLRRAMEMSSEADQQQHPPQYSGVVEGARGRSYELEGGGGGDEDEELRRAIEASRAEETADEEQLRRALEESERHNHESGGGGGGGGGNEAEDDEEQLRQALEASQQAHREELARQSTMRSEEDVVMEYVKRQSLAEAEYRRQVGHGGGGDRGEGEGGGEGAMIDEEELVRRAIEESTKAGNGVGSSSGS